MVSKGASIPLQIDCGWWNQAWTRAARWKLTLSHITTNLGWSGLFCTTILWRASRNVSICWLLYGPSFAWWCRSPRRLMAAHNVIFPPRCPGTCTIALWPITLRPRRLVCSGRIQLHQWKWIHEAVQLHPWPRFSVKKKKRETYYCTTVLHIQNPHPITQVPV